MNTKLVLTLAAIFLGSCGLIFSFLPQEIILYLNFSDVSPIFILTLQILGSLYLSLAIVNWISRANLIGGIYNKPLALGNTLHFAVCTITLLKYYFKNTPGAFSLTFTIIYALFALVFFKIIFTTPKQVTHGQNKK